MELRDLRAKIYADTDQVLDAVARATGMDKSEVVREWLAERARQEFHKAKMIVRLAKGEGNAGSDTE